MAACLECGRCTLNCPTVNTQKSLNPKHLVIGQREQITPRHGLSILQSQSARWAQKETTGADDANTGGEGGDIALNELGERSTALYDGEHDAAWLQNADRINDVATQDEVIASNPAEHKGNWHWAWASAGRTEFVKMANYGSVEQPRSWGAP
mgnify:CR=1 FL=1